MKAFLTIRLEVPDTFLIESVGILMSSVYMEKYMIMRRCAMQLKIEYSRKVSSRLELWRRVPYRANELIRVTCRDIPYIRQNGKLHLDLSQVKRISQHVNVIIRLMKGNQYVEAYLNKCIYNK